MGCWFAVAGGWGLLEDALSGAFRAAARGVGDVLRAPFRSTTNAAGGTVWTSEGTVVQSDFAGIVNNGLYNGEGVNILSGVHGFTDGTMLPDFSLYQEDIQTFGDIPGINVYNLPSMSPGELDSVLNGPGTTIGGFCNSAACLLGR